MTSAAVRAAISLSQGGGAGRYIRGPLPEGMDELLRLVMERAEDEASSRRREAVWLFLKEVVFHDAADDYRLLAAKPGASSRELRQNRRLLLQWLHPDVSPTGGDTRLLQRLNDAWQRIERGEGRLPVRVPCRGRPVRSIPPIRVSVMFRPGFGVGRRVLLITVGLAMLTLLAISVLEWLSVPGRCPDFIAPLPFCRFTATSDLAVLDRKPGCGEWRILASRNRAYQCEARLQGAGFSVFRNKGGPGLCQVFAIRGGGRSLVQARTAPPYGLSLA